MADIKYTPSELLEQSAELSNLQSEYDALFSKTAIALNGINESWSENLARNFSGKIQSAQKSFSSILNMLTNGSAAAKLGATSHSPTSIESFFKSLDGGADQAAGGEQIRASMTLTDQDKKDLYNMLPKEAQKAIEGGQSVDKWLAEHYNSIPEAARKVIESKLPSGVKDRISVVHDVISGEADFSTTGKAASIITGDKLKGSAFQATVEAVYNSKLDTFDKASDLSVEKAYNSFSSGDVGGGIMYTLEAMGHETRGFVYATGDAFTNLAGLSLEATRIPVVTQIGSAIHKLL